MSTTVRTSAADLLQKALHEGQRRYFDRCLGRVPGFVDRHMSFAGAARRYYPPRPGEILRLALSVALTPPVMLAQLVLWALRRDRHPRWVALREALDRFTRPRAHVLLAQAVRDEVFAEDAPVSELFGCTLDAPTFPLFLEAALSERFPTMEPQELESVAEAVVLSLRDGTPTDSVGLDAFVADTRKLLVTTTDHDGLASVVAGESARADVVNTILTGVIAKMSVGQMKLGAYGIALLVAPPLYFRWSPHREEKIRRTIDSILPDGSWSLSRAGREFHWTDSVESFLLVAGIFLAVSALLSVAGYLLAPVLAPLWKRTGLPAATLRRAVLASRDAVGGRRTATGFTPEVLASRVGDVLEII